MAKIIVVGSINMDVVVRVPHIPREGETLMASDVNHYGGGKGANQAIAAGRLGGEVSMIGRIGNDEYGNIIYNNLVSSGINVQGVEMNADNPTGTAYINVSDRGENNIVVFSGANSRLDPEQINRHEYLFEKAEFCLIQMEIPIETIGHVIHICKIKGVKLLLNPAPAQTLNQSLLRDVYMILPNESELDILCPHGPNIEDKARYLYELGVQNVLVTLGSKGSMLLNRDGIQYFSAIYVKPIDTTAAGDSFIGGLAVGLSEKMEASEAISFASVVAGIAVSREGAQASIPDRKTVDAYISQHSPF